MATDPEAKGLALAAFGLAHGLLSTLTAKGVIEKQQADDLLDGILTGLESTEGANDPGFHEARRIVDGLVQAQADAHRKGSQ